MRLGITAREGLPGEIIVAERKVAGKLFKPLLEDGGDCAVVGKACQLVILAGRNAKAEQRTFSLRQPAHHRLVEQRCDLAVEEPTLFIQRAAIGHFGQLDAVQARHKVAGADETAEQTGAVYVPVEYRDAATAGQGAFRPVGLGRVVEMVGDESVVAVTIAARIGAAELANHILMGREMAEGGKLQFVEGDVMRVEIHHIDAGRVAG
ncbi:hypothetical protein D3C87_1351700 [compost metagenome]